MEYRILSPTSADIYAKPSVSALVRELGEEGCELLSVEERDESLESYYIRLVGGDAE